jgi:two-component system, OmpR family, KDP operon response regulator KdpE
MSIVMVIGSRKRCRRIAIAALRDAGYDIKSVDSVGDAGGIVRRAQIRAVVHVDVTPPSPEILRDLRVRTDAPIIVVSEVAHAADRVAVLDAGADEYITSPFDPDEFLARLRALLRRAERPADEPPLVTDDFAIHLADRRLVLADGREAPLSPTEWKLVEVLVRRPGHLITQDLILRSVWGSSAQSKPGLLRVHLSSIRRKVEPDPARPRYFVTVPGLGIRFSPTAADARGSAS